MTGNYPEYAVDKSGKLPDDCDKFAALQICPLFSESHWIDAQKNSTGNPTILWVCKENKDHPNRERVMAGEEEKKP